VVLPFEIADRIARLAEADRVGVDVIGDARGPLICLLSVWCTPVVAAIARLLDSALATVLLHVPRKISLAARDGAVESFRVVREAGNPS